MALFTEVFDFTDDLSIVIQHCAPIPFDNCSTYTLPIIALLIFNEPVVPRTMVEKKIDHNGLVRI